jgi:hypothetical protein
VFIPIWLLVVLLIGLLASLFDEGGLVSLAAVIVFLVWFGSQFVGYALLST